LSGVKTKPSRGHILGKLPQDRAYVPQKPDTTNYSEENKEEALQTCLRAFYDAYEHNKSESVMCREREENNIMLANDLLVCSIIEPISWAKKGRADFTELIKYLAECEVAIDNHLTSVSNDY